MIFIYCMWYIKLYTFQSKLIVKNILIYNGSQTHINKLMWTFGEIIIYDDGWRG